MSNDLITKETNMTKRAKPKQDGKRPVIDPDYVGSILTALQIHGPCRELMGRAREFLSLIEGVRRPWDFQLQYTGYLDLRWHERDAEFFGSSKRYVVAQLGKGGVSLRGELSPDRGYGDRERTNIAGLPVEDAATILRLLVTLIDRPLAIEGERAR